VEGILPAIDAAIVVLEARGETVIATRLRAAAEAAGTPRGGRRSELGVQAQVARARFLEAQERESATWDRMRQAIAVLDGPVLHADRAMDGYLRTGTAARILEEGLPGVTPRKV